MSIHVNLHVRGYPKKSSLEADLMFFVCLSSDIGPTNLKNLGKRLWYDIVSFHPIFWFGSQIFSSNLKKWKTILAPISQVIFITQVTLLKQSFEVDIILGDWGWTGQGNAGWTERYERFWGSVGCYPIHFSQPRSRIIRPNWRFLSRYRKKAQTELEIDEQYDLLPGYRRVLPETP